MSDRRFADTIVLVHLFDADAPAKREWAREILATNGVEGRLVISTQVLLEWFVTVTRPSRSRRRRSSPLSTASRNCR